MGGAFDIAHTSNLMFHNSLKHTEHTSYQCIFRQNNSHIPGWDKVLGNPGTLRRGVPPPQGDPRMGQGTRESRDT